MKRTQEQLQQKQDAIKSLRKFLKPGKKVYTILKRVSSSGMNRDISCVTVHKGEIIDLDWYVSRALQLTRNPKNGAVKIGGCGMDMGFDLVYRMGRVMYPDGFKLPKGKLGRNGDTSGFDKDGGYALKQEWI